MTWKCSIHLAVCALIASTATAADCNSNGIDDAVEIQGNPQLDCDGDGLLNACELALVANDDVVHIGYGFTGSAAVTANDIVGNGSIWTVQIEITSNPVQGFLPSWGFGDISYNHTAPNLARDCSPSTDIVRYRLVDCAGNISNIATLTVIVDHPIPDCNCNWEYDYDETNNGEALDNDGNHVPDECEGPPGPCRVEPVFPTNTDSQLNPDLSANGRYLVYTRSTFSGIFIHFADLQLGNSELIAQIMPSGTSWYGHASSVSDDGRFVAFPSTMSTLVPGDTNGVSDVFVRDRQLGITRRISLTAGWGQANGPSESPVISGDGRWVVFGTRAANINQATGQFRIYLFDLHAVQPALALTPVQNTGGPVPNGSTYEPSISQDGRYVAFASDARNLIPGAPDSDDTGNIFRFDRLAAPGLMIQKISVGIGGSQANGWCYQPSISADGRFIAFLSYATNLIASDVGGYGDAFVRDTLTGTTRLVSTGANGQANGEVQRVRIAPDGVRVAFCTWAPNLFPPGFTIGTASNVFVRDLSTDTTTLWSVGDLGAPGNGDCGYEGVDLGSGGEIVFTSGASNFIATPWPPVTKLFARSCAPAINTGLCAGDGSGSQCPCGNNSASGSGRGCLHSFGAGARLLGTGVSRVLADTVTITLSDVPASIGQTTTFYQGTRLAGGGAGTVFGDGLRCAVGTVLRLGTRSAAVGSASFGFGIGGDPLLSTQGVIPGAGGTRYYQATYRNALGFCTAATFNTSNGIEIIWVP